MNKNCNENKYILVNIYNNILDIKFLEYNKQLFIINIPINLEVRVSFLC